MARSDEVVAAWAAVDAATNALGVRVQTLIDQINRTATEGLDGPQTEAVLANLASLKSVLDAMGSNPTTPIPAPTPTPPSIPGPFA